MENSEIKKKMWKEAKVKFLVNVPKRFKVIVDGLDDESEYCHPTIILDEHLKIRGQMDIRTNYVYGQYLQLTNVFISGNYIYAINMPIMDDDFDYLINNYEKINGKLMEAFDEVKKIYSLKLDLDTIERKIIESTITKEVDKSKLKDSIDKIYSVTEYLENQRLTL